MRKLLSIAGLASLAASAQDQIPLGALSDDIALGTVAPSPVMIDSQSLQDTITAENLLKRAKKLYQIAKLGEDEYNHPTRVIGGHGHVGTLAYIWATLQELGDYYDISRQPFPAVSGHVSEARLIIGNDVPRSASAMSLSPPTKRKQPVRGDLVLVEHHGCDAADFPALVEGNIAFILRGDCPFGQKSELAGRAGAIGAVVYNNEPGSVHGTLGTPSPDHVATFGLSQEEAAPVLETLKAGSSVDCIAYMDSEVNIIRTTNILAQTKGGDPDNCVMLGGHSDSVSEGPGINDDGSGSMSILEVATQLVNFDVNNCVRFAWWSGEEEGLLGSDYYVAMLPAEENLKIRLFMDYDMMASPNFAYQIYDANDYENPSGSGVLKDLYVKWYEEQGLNYTFIPFDGRSDYDGFIRHGIPGGGIATGAEGIKTHKEEKMFGGTAGEWYDPCYHQLCDDVGNLNMTAWVANTKVGQFVFAFEMVWSLTRSHSLLPIPSLPLRSHLMTSLRGLWGHRR